MNNPTERLRRFVSASAVILVAGLVGGCGQDEPAPGPEACHQGVYRLDGTILDLADLSVPGLRWRTLGGETGRLQEEQGGVWSGTRGWTDEAHPARFDLGACDDDTVVVNGLEGMSGEFQRVPLEVEETRFAGEGVSLAGRLVTPEGEGPFPLAVLVHGSEDWSALDYAFMQRMLPAQGVAAFVYDKRGTGRSEGDYTQDFDLLAADAAAALAEARRLGGERISAAGYFGGSQGGWVAPLAATLGEADFVVVAYGLATGPVEEDRQEVAYDLRRQGFSEADIARAGEVTRVTGRLMATRFREGGRELADLKRRYSDEAWFEAIEGEYSGDLLNYPVWMVRLAWPFLDRGTTWEYDPSTALDALDIPVLWVLAGEDGEAPSGPTREILETRAAAGQPIDIVVFEDADHGMRVFEEGPDGGRVYTGVAPGYFELVADWIARRGDATPSDE